MASAQLFDRKFVFAAVAIGFSFALIVALFGALLGKEAAGVVGVALSAVATGLVRQFETLRFRQVPEGEVKTVDIPGMRVPRLLLLLLAVFGAQAVVGAVAAMITPLVTPIGSLEDYTKPVPVAIGKAATVVAYALGGFVCGKLAPSRRYSYAALASLSVLLLVHLLPALVILVSTRERFDISYLAVGTYWLGYVAAALAGAWLASRGSADTRAQPAPATAAAPAPPA